MSFRSLSAFLNSTVYANRADKAFTFRAGQLHMARHMEAAISASEPLVVEAPSGSGKTLAYLIPALLQDRPVIISTATRYLQKQLLKQDIPLAQQLLSCNKSIALLEGRGHYFCPYYAEKNQHSPRLKPELVQQLMTLNRKFRLTGNGELSSLGRGLPSELSLYASCDVDDCLGKTCPQYDNCPYFAATRKAADAQVVIVNHSILFSEHSPLLPGFAGGKSALANSVVITDEAHRVLDVGENLLQASISSQKIKQLCRDIDQVLLKYCPEQKTLLQFVQQITQALDQLSIQLPTTEPYQRKQHLAIVEQLILTFERLKKYLDQLTLRDVLLQELSLRCQNLLVTMRHIAQPQLLCWVQARGEGFFIKAIPADLSRHIRQFVQRSALTWLFTSATLSIAGSPSRFLTAIGLEERHYRHVAGDIDHRSQAVLYVPALVSNPADSGFVEEFAETLVSLLEHCEGRVLVLFSSFNNLEATASYLQSRVLLPLFKQSRTESKPRGSKRELVQQFTAMPKGLLLGTGSFWEGLDLSGVPLSAVVIDKLPFASPASPLLQLRQSELARHGIDAFEQSVLPDAVMRLRQGCGRLLRRRSDRGVIMIADKRLQTMPYGEVFLNSLPPMPQISSIEQLKTVLAQWRNNPLVVDETTGEEVGKAVEFSAYLEC